MPVTLSAVRSPASDPALHSLRNRGAAPPPGGSSVLRGSPSRALAYARKEDALVLGNAALSNVRSSLVASLEDDVRRLRIESGAHRQRSASAEALLKEALDKLQHAQLAGPLALAERRAAEAAAAAEAQLDETRERLLANEAREKALDAEVAHMRGERGAFAKRLGIAEQGLASVKDEAAGVAAEAEAALTREQQAREAAERTLADARLVAEHSAREIAQALAALAEARAALSEARGAEADAHLEAEQARDREGAAIALAQSLTSYTRHTGKTSAIADAAALGGLQRTPSTGTPMPRSSAPSSISSGKGELPKGGKGDLSVTLKTAHRAELLRVQAVHNAALEFERTERSKADKKAATAVARATRLASELDALKGGKPPVAEPSAGGSTPGSVPESRRGSKVNLLERRDSSARDPFVALSKAEARGRDLERRLADAAKARDEARSSGAGAEKEAALMKTALSLAEEQLKQLVPEFGEWRQGVIPASKQLHASHFVRMAKMQAEIAELHAERDEREKDTRRAAGEADAGPAEPAD